MDREFSEEELERVMAGTKDTSITRSYLETLKSEIKRADADHDGKLTEREIEDGELNMSELENVSAGFPTKENETGRRM